MITPNKNLAICLTLIALFSCDNPVKKSMEEESQSTRGPKNGEWIARRDDGTIKTRVNYKDGIKDGVSTLFYKDGKTPQLRIPYVRGKRHGTSVKYFEDGAVYAETNYSHDRLDGVRTTYYRSGQLKAKISYRAGRPGSDLEEYYQSGTRKEMPEIVHSRDGSSIIVFVNAPCTEPSFFFGGLDEDGFFDQKRADKQLLTNAGQFIIDLGKFTPSYLKFQDLVCNCKSTQGNPVIIKKRIVL